MHSNAFIPVSSFSLPFYVLRSSSASFFLFPLCTPYHNSGMGLISKFNLLVNGLSSLDFGWEVSGGNEGLKIIPMLRFLAHL